MPPTQLTKREAEIHDLAAAGQSNEEIAARLNLSRRTVEAHLRMVYRKTGLSRRADLGRSPGPIDVPAQTPSTDSRIRDLESELALRDRQLERYEQAVQLIVDRQFPLFQERLDITIMVGSTSQEDVVTEKHWTDPKPYLVYRLVRPITAVGTSEDLVDDLELTCEVDRADVGVAVQLVPDRDNRPRALVTFQPGLDRPAGWILHYRAPGLWDPLRADGSDRLVWVSGTLDQRHTKGIVELRIRFEFPPTAENADVQQARGAGQMERLSPTSFVYADLTETGGRHEFELRMKPML